MKADVNTSDSDPVPDESKRIESIGRRPADLTLPAALTSRATTDPEDVFRIHGDESVTFGQLKTRAEALAASLHGLGIEPGDRVAVVMPSWPEFVISMFAVAKLGAVLVPLNPRLTADDLRYTLRHRVRGWYHRKAQRRRVDARQSLGGSGEYGRRARAVPR